MSKANSIYLGHAVTSRARIRERACLYIALTHLTAQCTSHHGLSKKNDEPMQSKDIVYFLYSVSKSSCFKYQLFA